MTRRITHRYVDPLDAVWLTAARRIGLEVVRSDEAFASTDGAGRLVLGTGGTLDPDDHLAQMVLHELCHGLVAGPDAFRQVDWGLANEDDRHLEQEQACLRVQAALADAHGLRDLLAPTTEHRAFWNALPAHPLDPGGHGGAGVRLAAEALSRVATSPWHPHLDRALTATAAIADVLRAAGALAEPPPGDDGLASLWSTLATPGTTGG